jgi:hypothetical protein
MSSFAGFDDRPRSSNLPVSEIGTGNAWGVDCFLEVTKLPLFESR